MNFLWAITYFFKNAKFCVLKVVAHTVSPRAGTYFRKLTVSSNVRACTFMRGDHSAIAILRCTCSTLIRYTYINVIYQHNNQLSYSDITGCNCVKLQSLFRQEYRFLS